MASSTPSEDMLKQAQHIWGMLDELAESDPETYTKFLEKNMKESQEVMAPAKPYICIQTKILRPKFHMLFINICSWARVPKPKTDKDPISIAGGPLEEHAHGQESYKVARLAINPNIVEECWKNTEDRAMLIQLALQYLEHQHSLGISRHYTIIKDCKYKGDPSVLLKNFFLKKEDEKKKCADDISSMSPDSLLTRLGRISTDTVSKDTDLNANKDDNAPCISLTTDSVPSKHGLIEEITSADVKLEVPEYEVCVKEADGRRPRRLVVMVSLPQVTSVKSCELDITEDKISLKATDKYNLQLLLPERIDESSTSAKFSSKTSLLTITLPTHQT